RIFARGYARNTILATLAASGMLIAYWGINMWLPTFLVKQHGFEASRMSLYLLVLNAGMFCGYPLLAWLANRIGKRRALMLSFF
ncbi:MFS transporter, partial [Halalkalibacter lacteus]|uniref:MFS transporter n=1 Tax=Halalkalibacter lacteus TaxID=3090663 RepID=UPI002FCB97AF